MTYLSLILALLLIGMEVTNVGVGAQREPNIRPPVLSGLSVFLPSGFRGVWWGHDRGARLPSEYHHADQETDLQEAETEALTQAQEIELAVNAWFLPEDVPTALCIIQAESGFRPEAISPWGDYGLFQLNRIHAVSYDWDRILEIEYNVAAAHDLWTTNGWRPWSTRYLCGA